MAHLKRFVALAATLMLLGTQAIAFAADTVVPSDVENLEATPGDGEVTLEWDAATDNTGVAGYYVYSGLSSVTENGGSYTFGSEDTKSSDATYTVGNLSNDVTYYFAVTAYDAEGNESEFYSVEVEATPTAGETEDTTEPTVTSANALTSTLVEVEFSEEVSLPTAAETAFSIESAGGDSLEVLDAYLSDNESVVFVVTAEQVADEEYILTAGIEIEDAAGNPVVSGTSDTAVFTGSALEAPEVDEEDTDDDTEDSEEGIDQDFILDEVELTDELNELILHFSEDVEEPSLDAFTIQLMEDATQEVYVIAISMDEDDASVVTLLLEDMEAGADYLLSWDETVVTTDGLAMDEEARSIEFTAATLDLADLIAPEDITNLLASIVNETTVKLTWEASLNSAGDLAKYLVYRSSNGVDFGTALEVAMDLTDYEYSGLTPGESYTFKVTAVDENGNESEGVMVSATLPETGPGMIALGGLSLLGAGMITRRRRED